MYEKVNAANIGILVFLFVNSYYGDFRYAALAGRPHRPAVQALCLQGAANQKGVRRIKSIIHPFKFSL